MSKENEFTFEPAALSDFTLHFAQFSFHLHAFLLVTKSKYFESLLNDASSDPLNADCSVTDACARPGHRCLSFDSLQIGGVDVSMEDLNAFFAELYDASNARSGSMMIEVQRWQIRLTVGEPVDILHDGCWQRACVSATGNGQSVLRRVGILPRLTLPSGSLTIMPPYSQHLGPTSETAVLLANLENAACVTGPEWTGTSLPHLAHYFDCPTLTTKLDCQARDFIVVNK